MSFEQDEIYGLTLLCNIFHTYHSDRDLKKAMEQVARIAVSVLKIKGCSIKVLDERHSRLDFLAVYGLSPRFIEKVGKVGMFKNPINQEALSGKSIFIDDIAEETNYKLPGAFKEEGIVALASLPLKLESHVIGVFSIYDDRSNYFNEKEKAFLKTLANQSASIINSARSFERVETLIDVAKTINSSLDLDRVLDELVTQAARSLKCRAASIRLLNESDGSFIFKTSYGLSREYIDKIPKILEDSPVEKEVLETKKILYVEDLSKDPRIVTRAEAAEEGLVSMLCAPLVFQDKSIGTLKVYTSAKVIFTVEEFQFLEQLAQLGSVAVRNASFYEKIHSLYQVSSSLSSLMETERILELLSIHAADYISAAGAMVLIWDKEKENFATHSAYNLSKEFVESLDLSMDKWSVQESMKGNTIISTNVCSDDRLSIRSTLVSAGINSMISIPIKSIERITGVLQVYCKTCRNFTPDEVEFLTTLVNHAAIAIENAKIHEYFKNEYENLIDDIFVWHDWTSYIIRED